MKCIKRGLFIGLILGIFHPLFPLNNDLYKQASDYLARRNEVYFVSWVNSRDDIQKLSQIISIDKVTGNTFYAYANQDEFHKFLEHNLYYEVLTPPSELMPEPVMSDYADRENRQWDIYPTYQGYLNLMSEFESEYPELCKIYEVGESFEGRKLLIAKISDNVTEREMEPIFYNTSTMHGDETFCYVAMLRIIDELLSSYGTDPRLTRIVDSMEMWISPLLNPDGTYYTNNNTVQGSKRYTAEGIDLNRNFPDPVSGDHPDGNDWARETVAYMEFEKQHNFMMSGDYHGGIEAVEWPWACWAKETADDDWFAMVSNQYADLAHENSPDGYLMFQGGACNLYHGWGEIHGTRLDWILYFRHCRQFCIELNNTKTLPESQLDTYYDYNREALLTFFEQLFYGIRGTVVDSITGEGIDAKVFIENHDIDSSWIYTNLPHGDYYRPIYQGTYDITFSSENYFPKTVSGVTVENDAATVLNVKLRPTQTVNDYPLTSNPKNIALTPYRQGIKITWSENEAGMQCVIYGLNGVRVNIVRSQYLKGKNCITWNGKNRQGKKVGSGVYVIQLYTANKTFSKHFVYSP